MLEQMAALRAEVEKLRQQFDGLKSVHHSNTLLFQIVECKLSTDLGKILANGRCSDITLVTGDEEFIAHEAVLAGKCYRFSSIYVYRIFIFVPANCYCFYSEKSSICRNV